MALDLATSACVRRGPPFRRRSTARRPGHLSSTLSPMLSSEESSHPNAPDAVRLQGFTDRGGEFVFMSVRHRTLSCGNGVTPAQRRSSTARRQKFSCILFSKYGTCAIVVSVDKF